MANDSLIFHRIYEFTMIENDLIKFDLLVSKCDKYYEYSLISHII